MIFSSALTDYFQPVLTRRKLSFSSETIASEEKIILTEIGLPNGVLDFNFREDIVLKSESELVIGQTLDNAAIVLQLASREITKGDGCFLAASLSNFFKQLYVYDRLWKVLITNGTLGHYREDRNHKKYAALLENQLSEIDSDLLGKDNCYFWGSLIEDIDFGIVG